MKKNGGLLNILIFISSLQLLIAGDVEPPVALNDSLRRYSVDSLKSLSISNYYSNSNLSKLYACEILNRGLKNSTSSYLVDAYYLLGILSMLEGTYNDALSSFEKGMLIAKKNNDSFNLLKFNINAGNAHLYLDDYKKALLKYENVISLAKELKTGEYEIIGYLNIALIKKDIGQFEEALEIEKENVKRAENITFSSKRTPVTLLLNLSSTYLNLKENDSSIFYAKKGLKLNSAINDLECSSYLYNILGCAYQNKQQDSIALSYFIKSLPIIEKFKNRRRVSATHYLLGKSYATLSELTKAVEHLLKAEELVMDIPDIQTEELTQTYRLLANIYTQQNKAELANEYYKKYIKSDSLTDLSKTTIIGDLYYKNIEKKQSQLQKIAKEKYNLKFFIGVGIFILCIAVISLFILMKKSKNYKNELKKLSDHSIKSLYPKNSTPSLKEEKAREILKKLENIELKEYFLKSDFSLNTLAKKLKSNPSYVSRVINLHKKMPFHEYTNKLRIDYTLKRLQNDSKFRSYSILHISKEVGYKSQDSFTKHFKKRTGSYPSSYISNLKKSQLLELS